MGDWVKWSWFDISFYSWPAGFDRRVKGKKPLSKFKKLGFGLLNIGDSLEILDFRLKIRRE